jgi:hypothetical protein
VQEFEKTAPGMSAGLGVGARRTALVEKSGHSLHWQTDCPYRSGSTTHEDQMSRALVFQMPKWIAVMMGSRRLRAMSANADEGHI